jgi:hypothetical protein
VPDGVPLRDAVPEFVPEADCAVGVEEPVPDGVPVLEAVTEAVPAAGADAVTDADSVPVLDDVPVLDGVPVPVLLAPVACSRRGAPRMPAHACCCSCSCCCWNWSCGMSASASTLSKFQIERVSSFHDRRCLPPTSSASRRPCPTVPLPDGEREPDGVPLPDGVPDDVPLVLPDGVPLTEGLPDLEGVMLCVTGV